MNLGIIGFSGHVQRAYIPYLCTHPEIEVRAVCDTCPLDELDSLLRRSGLSIQPKLVSQISDLRTADDLDAVLVSTPHAFHYEQVHTCLEANYHVFVDKPLACHYADALRLVQLADKRSLALAVGNQRRYEPPYQQLKMHLQKGDVGKIHLVNYLFANSPWYDYRLSWRGKTDLHCGGAMMDIGYLASDTLIWLLDQPLRWVQAVGSIAAIEQPEQTVIVTAQFGDDILVNMAVSYAAPPPSVQEELSIYGTELSLFSRRFRSKRFAKSPPQIIRLSATGEAIETVYTKPPELWRPLEDFCNSVMTGSPIASDGRSHLGTIELIDTVYQSIREQRRIDITH
jgi:predicted dehydrogenase